MFFFEHEFFIIYSSKNMPTYLGDIDDMGKCYDVIKHMRSCPECQKQFTQQNNYSFFTSTNVTIIALLIVIGMLLVKLK